MFSRPENGKNKFYSAVSEPKFILSFFIVFFFCFLSADRISFENITVFANKKDLPFAEKIVRQISSDIDNFQMKIGLYPNIPVRIVIAADKAEYAKWTANSSKLIEFSEAFFDNRTQTIYIRNPRNLKSYSLLRSIVLHEYIHLYVSHFWKNPPLWFNEGMAVYFSSEFDFQREFRFIRDYFFGKSHPLSEMESHYPFHRSEWQSFYAKSAFAVKYLYTNRRKEFFKLWDNALPTGDFRSAFRKSFMMTTGQFSRLFENYCRHHFKAEILLASSGVIWGIMPIIFIIALIKKQRAMLKIHRRWKDEEYYEKTENQ